MKSRSKANKKISFDLSDPGRRKKKSPVKFPWVFLLISGSLIGLIGGAGLLLSAGIITVGGIPAPMIWRFIQDPVAMEAFTNGRRTRLHDRLQELGFEEQIKDYYRPRISDEVELDRYIHQLMYYWSGYVGDNYMVNSQNKLVLKSSGVTRLERELERKNDNTKK